MTQLSKAQVCELLGISSTTLWRRLRAGTYTSTRTGEGQFASLSFSLADIGLPEPEAISAPEPSISTPRNPPPSKVGSYEDVDDLPADDFAARYAAGLAAASAGNKIDGSTTRWSATHSLLGPASIEHGPPVESQAHMNPALLGTHDSRGNPIEAHRPALANGLTPEAYATMMQSWRRSGGGRSESEQEQRIRQSKANISRSFPHA